MFPLHKGSPPRSEEPPALDVWQGDKSKVNIIFRRYRLNSCLTVGVPLSLTPIEVKWTEHPTLHDARHRLTFLAEKQPEAKHGYVMCRCPRPLQLHEQITALPWFCLLSWTMGRAASPGLVGFNLLKITLANFAI